MSETLNVGDTIDVETASTEYLFEDWGEIIDGEYTYAMIDDDGTQYTVAVSEYEVKDVIEYDN